MPKPRRWILNIGHLAEPREYGEQFCYLTRVDLQSPVSISRSTRSAVLMEKDEGATRYSKHCQLTKAEYKLLIAQLEVHREKCIELIDDAIRTLNQASFELVEENNEDTQR